MASILLGVGCTPEGGLHVRFQFKDHTGQLLVFEHTYDYQRTLDLAARFGLPSTFFRPFFAKELPNRQKLLDNGLFRRDGSAVVPDDRHSRGKHPASPASA
jgi:hypothetical protein